jgi:hypothetical protein
MRAKIVSTASIVRRTAASAASVSKSDIAAAGYLQEQLRLAILVSYILLISSFLLAGCQSPQPKRVAPDPERYSKLPTATEVFNLRTKCAQLGDKLDDLMMHGDAVNRETLTNYSVKENRCYVVLDDTIHHKDGIEYFRALYDGQTREQLAWTKYYGTVPKPQRIGEITSNTTLYLDECTDQGDCGLAKVEAWIDERMKREE